MATDSDRTTAELERQGQEQRAAAQRRNPHWQDPPESPAVKAQRDANDRHGKAIDPWQRGRK